MDKRKRLKLNLEVFRDIFKICPRVQGQDFDALPTNEEIVSFLRDPGHTGEIYSLNYVVDQMHQPWRTFVALINRSLSEKTTGLDKLRLLICNGYTKNGKKTKLKWANPSTELEEHEKSEDEGKFIFNGPTRNPF
ncbi:hypothetical protein Tco_0688234 [Tanacetum coccineum]